jgi:hypothetical protein
MMASNPEVEFRKAIQDCCVKTLSRSLIKNNIKS